MADIQGHQQSALVQSNKRHSDDFVLEKTIFSNVFDKDIQRVYLYKKAERLGKAIHLILPGLAASPSLKGRAEGVAVALVDAAILPPAASREALSRELLALSSVLSIARAGGHLSAMNAELIAREAQLLLAEVAAYEPPRLSLPAAPSLSSMAKQTTDDRRQTTGTKPNHASATASASSKGHLKDTYNHARREAVLSVIKERGSVYIKDISKVVRDVSEKTIQRELAALVREGVVARRGERRWTLYSLA